MHGLADGSRVRLHHHVTPCRFRSFPFLRFFFVRLYANLNLISEQKRMQALYSLHDFLAFHTMPYEWRANTAIAQAIDSLVSEHGQQIAAILHRRFTSERTSVAEKLLVARLTGFFSMWSLDSSRIIREAQLLTALQRNIDRIVVRGDEGDRMEASVDPEAATQLNSLDVAGAVR